jgi:hypothetical protein
LRIIVGEVWLVQLVYVVLLLDMREPVISVWLISVARPLALSFAVPVFCVRDEVPISYHYRQCLGLRAYDSR